MGDDLKGFAYLFAAICFILALRGLSSPESARNGNYFGITGMVVSIIHSGLFPDSMNDSINFNLLIARSSATLDFTSFNIDLNFSFSAFKSKFINKSLIASAPIEATKESSPYSS